MATIQEGWKIEYKKHYVLVTDMIEETRQVPFDHVPKIVNFLKNRWYQEGIDLFYTTEGNKFIKHCYEALNTEFKNHAEKKARHYSALKNIKAWEENPRQWLFDKYAVATPAHDKGIGYLPLDMSTNPERVVRGSIDEKLPTRS